MGDLNMKKGVSLSLPVEILTNYLYKEALYMLLEKKPMRGNI